MQPVKTTRLLFTFYKSFLLLSVLITGCCLLLFRKYGLSIFTALFWFKIITLGFTYHYINKYKSKEYYYYQNLGLSKLWLWGVTLLFDFALFIFLITVTYKFK